MQLLKNIFLHTAARLTLNLMLKFTLHKKDGHARRGTLELNHGKIETPVFMPVGTYGSVKAMNPQNLHDIKAQIILGNTYHLWLRPGLEVIEQFGGLHEFIGWDKPILTDSGGFQVFSLSDMRKLTEEGCTFQSPINGDKLFLSPEVSMKIQTVLNSDIVMQLDECTPGEATHSQAQKSLQMSLRWAERSKKAFEDLKNPNALFGIVQGAMYEDLREESLKGLEELDFPGLAIGGLSVGEPKPEMYRMLRAVGPILPEHKPHYLMGVGTPEDLVYGVAHGVDMFDCVMPTRNGRNAMLFTYEGTMNMRNKKWETDFSPVDSNGCDIDIVTSKAYLHHLFKAGELLAMQIASIHNLAFYLRLVTDARAHIEKGDFTQWKSSIIDKLGRRL